MAIARLAAALYRFQASWRGHPDSVAGLYNLVSGGPWAVPRLLYRIPMVPVRIWLRIGDALLFRLWWYSRAPLEAITRAADPTYFERVHTLRGIAPETTMDEIWAATQREHVNADLALRDELGLAPDGGRFQP